MKEAPRCRGDAFLEGGLRTSSSQAPKHWLLLEELSGSGDDVPEGLLVGDALFDPRDDFGARPFNICRMPGPNSWKRLMPAWLNGIGQGNQSHAGRERAAPEKAQIRRPTFPR